MKKDNHKNHVIEKYRVLHNVLENCYKNGIKCIGVISNSDSEGKSVIANNLAMLLAVNGNRTLFIDCSLNNSGIVRSTYENETKGLVHMIKFFDNRKSQEFNNKYINDIQIKDYADNSKCEALWVLPLGKSNLDNYCLEFNTEVLKETIEHMKKEFDYIIIDAPSFNNLSYAQIVAGATDGCIFVLKEGINEIKEGLSIKDKLNTIGCKVLGCVLNKEKISTEIFDNTNDSFTNITSNGSKRKVNMDENSDLKA